MRLPSLQHLARTSRPSRTSSRLRPTGNPPNTALSRPALRPYTSAPAEDTDGEEDYDFGAFGVILPEEPYVWGVSHITPRAVPAHIARPPYARGEGVRLVLEDRPTQLGGADERRLREAARLARDVLRFAGSLVEVGVTTDSIDGQLHDYVLSHSAYPSPLLYRGFPRSCCTSINNVVTHGIPDQRPLQDGDIVNIDITVYKHGFHGDTSRTFLVGDVDEKGRELVKITEDALEAAIGVCAPGQPLNLIGKTIHELLRGTKYSVSTQFTGHGIGEDFHKSPWILHHLNDNPGVMRPGHCFTIEPCIVQGSNPRAWIFPDGWTASTENCARSAQAEHMVLITESGADVLTR
ncbi:methionine aminopeptidase [Rhodofomes roseus]|uniref:Methionine aminopeptidase n=1 Tax=Rhodofomes roseus TaxID=34475 RepID=A0ABQ8K959_9APHY|nr:methionine aminopeptidase [Rhodofomes roseus]KAH9833835.1 methionine aminopeptidase [Rhodofomes roseus]